MIRLGVFAVSIFNVTTYCRFQKLAFPTVYFLILGLANSIVWTLVSSFIYYEYILKRVSNHTMLESANGFLNSLYMDIGLALSLMQYHILFVMKETMGDPGLKQLI